MAQNLNVTQHAQVDWHGDLTHGNGELRLASGVLNPTIVSWKARSGKTQDRTTPEELIAAAEATCFSMALSKQLSDKGADIEDLMVSADCTLSSRDGGFAITQVDLSVQCKCTGIDEPQFKELAEKVGETCPVSKALHNNVEIHVNASLM